MKKYLCLILAVCSFVLGCKVFADEVAQKTDGSFVGDTFASNGEVQQKTDGGFVGSNTIQSQDSAFSGDSYDNATRENSVAPFAQQGSFVGENYGQ